MRPLQTAERMSEERRTKSCEVEKTEGVKRAVIQGRLCLAYQGGMCFTCSERCPEPGAITVEKGIPMVQADLCTGCGLCHDLCPAPVNAILMLDPPPGKPRPPATS